MTEYSRMAKGSYTVSGGAIGSSAPSVKVINLPFKPDFVQLINYTQAITPAQHGIPFAFWDASVPPITVSSVQYDTIVQVFNSTPVLTTDSVKVGGGISAFSGGLSQQFGPTQQIIGITKANPARVNVTAHGYSVGDTVIMQGLALATTNNMQLLNGVPFTIVTVSDADHFDVQWNTSQPTYTALSASPAGALVKKVLYPFLYLPQDNVISAVTTGATSTVITTTMYHNLEAGQEVAFRVTPFWGMIQLNSLPNVTIPGSPVYSYVNFTSGTVNAVVLDNWNFSIALNSTAFTAFTTNATMTAATLAGLTYAQVVPVGDVNSGGISYSGGALYPSPLFPNPNNRVSTINGPAIKGSFVNNTSQGFIIGNFHSRTDTSSWVGGSDGDVMEWRAYLHDYSSP